MLGSCEYEAFRYRWVEFGTNETTPSSSSCSLLRAALALKLQPYMHVIVLNILPERRRGGVPVARVARQRCLMGPCRRSGARSLPLCAVLHWLFRDHEPNENLSNLMEAECAHFNLPIRAGQGSEFDGAV